MLQKITTRRLVHALPWHGLFSLLAMLCFGFFLDVDKGSAAGQLEHSKRRHRTMEICAEGDGLLCKPVIPNQVKISLPDLQTLPPFDLQLFVRRFSGEKTLRFSNSVLNRGEGALELSGQYDSQTSMVLIAQVMESRDGAVPMRRIGEFDFHPEHNHWHWEGFSLYEIWTVAKDGTLNEMVVTSGKVGYCMLDTSRMDDEWVERNESPAMTVTERRQYGGCGWRRQGISSGWVDTYNWDTPGQVMDVTGIADGLYALRSTVDPDGLLIESNTENNSATVYFSIEDDELSFWGEELPSNVRHGIGLTTPVNCSNCGGVPETAW